TDFDIDLVTGPVLGPGRIVGIGGAYTALASSIEAAGWNPAAYAARGLWETDWFEWDLTGSLVPQTIKNSDFDNNGESGFTYDNFIFGAVGIGFRFGAFGTGALLNIQDYEIGETAELSLVVMSYGVGYALLDGQLVFGAGLRTAVLTISDRVTGEDLVDFAGSAPEAGAVLRLAGKPWRLGLAARMPVQSNGNGDTLVAAGLTLPRRVRLPWEVQAGFAWQLGSRPLNLAWVNPHDVEQRLREQMLRERELRAANELERERVDERLLLAQQRVPPAWASNELRERYQPRDATWQLEEVGRRQREEQRLGEEITREEAARERAVQRLSRRFLLLSADMILVGPTDNGVGLESFLSQQRQTSGAGTTLGVRIGAEGEPIANWVKMRAGTYFEPSRFDSAGYRVHATTGFDVRLFTWDLFGLVDDFTVLFGASADVAERYLNVGVGLGLWH
ncbi:MAG TPA: hypothetical protein VHM19_20665, partial [Polyangiales bacterium]|nr:hypothetical protein [Polyangiales bacterium]